MPRGHYCVRAVSVQILRRNNEQGTDTRERIETKILLLRGQKVMLDRDLAKLYEVRTSILKRAVRRNAERFPEDFMFVLHCHPIDL